MQTKIHVNRFDGLNMLNKLRDMDTFGSIITVDMEYESLS